jgi:ATP-dependent DNA ligase
MLPRVLPMLAVAAELFDSPEYCFEIKYDGVRALAAVDEMGWRVWGRERADYTARYPELEVLRRLPAGPAAMLVWRTLQSSARPSRRSLVVPQGRWGRA